MMKSIRSNLSRAVTKRRNVVANTQDKWVKVSPVDNTNTIPVVVEPAIENINFREWCSNNREMIDELLKKYYSILFRGFSVTTPETFAEIVDIISGGNLLEYRDRSTPREDRGNRIYTSTVYPAAEKINLHNEGTYWTKWARKIYFCCIQASLTGGETPIADVRKVYSRIPVDIRDAFETLGISYVRNYNSGYGLRWQEVFQCDSRQDVERYCQENRIDYEWTGADQLRTVQVRPAVREHPITKEKLWFNHGAFFHVTSLKTTVSEHLLQALGEENIPYNTFYGDGSPIDPEHVRIIMDAYNAERVLFKWQEGDLLLQDNMVCAHAREPYTGDREVLAALAEPYSPEDE